MNEDEKEILSQWLHKAEHDLIASRILIDADPIILDVACFHCQQAIEKFLKAFLISKNFEFPFTHNLDFLLKSCSDFDADFSFLDFKNLNMYAVRARYPHDHVMPDHSGGRILSNGLRGKRNRYQKNQSLTITPT